MKPIKQLMIRHPYLPRFLLSGGAATLLHWSSMAALVYSGMAAEAATATGATVGLVANYLAQHRFTFCSRLPHRRAFPRYLASALLGWLLNLACFALLHAWLDRGAIAPQLIATASVTFVNYLVAEKVVFNEKQTPGTY